MEKTQWFEGETGARKLVIIDTNFWLVPVQFKMDIFASIERLLNEAHIFVISTPIKRELTRLAKRPSKNGIAARFGLKLIEIHSKNIKYEKTLKNADDWIVEYAAAHRAFVATNDIDLKRRLQAYHLRTIVVRNHGNIGIGR